MLSIVWVRLALKAVNFECNDVQRLIYSVTKSYCKICVALNCIAALNNKKNPLLGLTVDSFFMKSTPKTLLMLGLDGLY